MILNFFIRQNKRFEGERHKCKILKFKYIYLNIVINYIQLDLILLYI